MGAHLSPRMHLGFDVMCELAEKGTLLEKATELRSLSLKYDEEKHPEIVIALVRLHDEKKADEWQKELDQQEEDHQNQTEKKDGIDGDQVVGDQVTQHQDQDKDKDKDDFTDTEVQMSYLNDRFFFHVGQIVQSTLKDLKDMNQYEIRKASWPKKSGITALALKDGFDHVPPITKEIGDYFWENHCI